MRRSMAIMLALVFVAFFVSAKKLTVVNIEKGELPSDIAKFICNLSEEHTFSKGGVSLKVEAEKYPTLGIVGEYNPRKGVWDGYDYFWVEYFNTAKKPVSLTLLLKHTGDTYQTRLDQNVMLRPGKGAIEVELNGACSNDGKAFDFKKKLVQWNLGGNIEAPIYFGSFQLLTSDELDKINSKADAKPAKENEKKDNK